MNLPRMYRIRQKLDPPVVADVAQLTKAPAFQAEAQKWLVTAWEDVEDWSAAILTFEDGTIADIILKSFGR